MNPYLRIKQQSIRPTSYLYAEHVLQGRWPEMEPVSSTRAFPRIEILSEKPIGEPKLGFAHFPAALATMGLFYGDELIAKLYAQKWLMVDNQVFVYTDRPHIGSPAAAGAPNVRYEDNERIIVHPTGTLYVFMDGIGPEDPRLERTLFPIDNSIPGSLQTFMEGRTIPGDQRLADEIREVLNLAYEEWHPAPPTNLTLAKASLLEALTGLSWDQPTPVTIECERPTAGRLEPGEPMRLIIDPTRSGVVINFIPPSKYTDGSSRPPSDDEDPIYVKWNADGTQGWVNRIHIEASPPKAFITYAIWRDGGIFEGKGFPVFAVTMQDASSELYFTPQSAVKAAYAVCPQTPSTTVVHEKVVELSERVRDSLIELVEEEG